MAFEGDFSGQSDDWVQNEILNNLQEYMDGTETGEDLTPIMEVYKKLAHAWGYGMNVEEMTATIKAYKTETKYND